MVSRCSHLMAVGIEGRRQREQWFIVFEVLSFRKRLSTSFAYLFGSGDEEEQGTQHDYSERTQFSKQWGWYNSIYAIAKGDLTKFDEVTRMGVRKCLTWLTYERQKNEIEHREFNRKLNKHG